MKKLMLVFMMLGVHIGMASAEPYFSFSSEDDWEAPVASGQIRPMSPIEWSEYMGQWTEHLDPRSKPYPVQTQFRPADLYVYEGGSGSPSYPKEGGLVMAWGNQNMPEGSYASAWIYKYGVDPDLSNCTITLTVMPPQFDQNGNQINNVSFGMKDINGNIRSWHWTCGTTGVLPWGISTTITINTAMTGVGAASPAASGYMNNPAFDITKVLSLIVDENAQWVGGSAPVPPPGQLIQRPWNLWADLMVSPNPANGGIIAGINIDIHQDIDDPTVSVNDFHIEGRIESGVPLSAGGGGWSNPPVLVTHIDDLFDDFSFVIVPDYSDPEENWFFIQADWKMSDGSAIPYCTVLHLGLKFKVTCHNVIIDIVGWWTSNGQPVQAGANGGYIPIPGFNVQDGIQMPVQTQQIRIQNGNNNGDQEPGEIPLEIVEMKLAALEPRILHELLGPEPFKQLRPGGLENRLPWRNAIQIRPNGGNPIPLDGGADFPADSFFDVFFTLDVENGPLVMNAGDFLIAKELIRFKNNAGQPELRWVWEIHEAHEDKTAGDLGDAPDSTNNFNMLMWTYPSGTQANFPTVYQSPGVPPHGPIHRQPLVYAHLGQAVTLEKEADIMADQDPTNNIIPPNNAADLDFADDGLIGLPLTMPNCGTTRFRYIVTNMTPAGQPKYFNAWADFNRDGDWDDIGTCTLPDGTTVSVPEHIVADQDLSALPPGVHTLTTPAFYSMHPTTAALEPIWIRLTLAEQKWRGSGAGVTGFGGSGPAAGYQYGETEDYYFTPKIPPVCGCADITGDGFVDLNDFVCFAIKWLQTCP